MMRSTTMALTIFLLSHDAIATTYVQKPVGELLEKSVAIQVVRIVEGRLIRVEYQDTSENCGFVYEGEVEDSLLGEGDSVEFMADRPLQIGKKYLVFLTNGESAGEDMASTNSMMWPAIEKEMDVRKLCESSYSGPKAISGLISEFKSRRQIKSGEEWIIEPWIEPGLLALEGVELYEFEAEMIKIYAPEKEVATLSADELLDDSIRPEGAVYPYVWLNEVLVKWSDYRAAIVAELGKLRESDNDSSATLQN